MEYYNIDKVRESLAELEDAINAEGFGCACMPDVKCATCKASDLMSKWVRPSLEKLREALSAQPAEPVAWEGAEGWEPLAWQLCADENGEKACNELVWEGGPVPEPWGDWWLKYEGEAKRMIDLVQKYAAPQPAPSVPAVAVPTMPLPPYRSVKHAYAAAPHPATKGEPT